MRKGEKNGGGMEEIKGERRRRGVREEEEECWV